MDRTTVSGKREDVRDSNPAQLVETARRGGVESFARLYERYYGSMVALAYSQLSDRHLAEDAAQEAFAVACDKLIQLRKSERFTAWLGSICRNVACQWNRTRRKVGEIAFMDENPCEPTMEDAERDGLIRKAIWQLPDSHREVIVLRYYTNLSNERIAEVLGISARAVHGRLFRAKRKIEKKLGAKQILET